MKVIYMSNSKMKRKDIIELAQLIADLDSKEKVMEFLRGILTLEEFENVVQRLQIIKLLKHNVPQRKIAEKLGVGIATITRGSKELKKGRFKEVVV